MRNHLRDKGLAISQHESQKWCNNSGLSRPHDHLVTHRLVVLERIHEFVYEDDLALSKHDRIGKLKDEVSGIEANEARIRAIHLHEVSLSRDIGSNLRCLQLDFLANSTALFCFVGDVDPPQQENQLSETTEDSNM